MLTTIVKSLGKACGITLLGLFIGIQSSFIIIDLAHSRCGEYYDCEEPVETYFDGDIEQAEEAARDALIDEYFIGCINIKNPPERLECYDLAMDDLGYQAPAQTDPSSDGD